MIASTYCGNGEWALIRIKVHIYLQCCILLLGWSLAASAGEGLAADSATVVAGEIPLDVDNIKLHQNFVQGEN